MPTSRNRIAALVAAALLALTAGCAQSPATVDVVTADHPGQDVIAAPAGSIDRAVDELDDLVSRTLDDSGVPGAAVAVVHDGQVRFLRGFGVRAAGQPATVDPDTVFQLASLSKPLSATAVAHAVGDGAVAWDTPIAEHLPGTLFGDPYVTSHATIGDAFAHRTGLPTGAGDDLEDLGYDRQYILDHLDQVPLGAFRTDYQYSNFGLTMGAESVARGLGEPWDVVMDRLVFTPLGMTTASARYSDFTARRNRATLHAKIGDGFQARSERDPDPQAPAGGVSASARDLSRWLLALTGGGEIDGAQVIDEDALDAAMSGQIVSGSGVPDRRASMYGFGFNVGATPAGRVTIGHSGAFVLGAGTAFTVLPDLDLAIVTLTNAAPVGVAEAINAQFTDLVQFGKVTRDWPALTAQALSPHNDPEGDLAGKDRPAAPAPAPAATALTGSYTNPYFGPMQIRQESGALIAALGPGGKYRVRLDPWDGDTFAFTPTGENAPDGSRSSARFTVDGGTASTVTLAFFDTRGLGTFTRTGE